MPAFTLFSLLKNRRFVPLLIVQFLGAFNDNVFKNALIILITYQLITQSLLWPQLLVTLAAGLFILPFFLFSAFAGQLADKLSRRYLTIVIKSFECIFMLLASLGFYLHSISLLMLVLFFMGAHSSFFGPIKYAILPDLLERNELIAGNALVEASTFIAILIGTILGGLLIANHTHLRWISTIIISIAGLGLFASFYIPTTAKAKSNLKLNFNFIQASVKIIQQVKTEKKVFLGILAISWFWLIGATFLTQFPSFTKNILQSDASVLTFLLVIFTVGVACGSLVCNRLLKQRISMKWIPISLWLMSIFMIDLYFASNHASYNSKNFTNFSNFFNSITHWRICLDLLGLSVSGGIYAVPLYTLIQTDTATEHRARTIAANNIINSLFIVISSIIIVFLLKIDLSVIQIFLLLGIINVGLAIYATRLIPQGLIKPLLRKILRCLYNVKLSGFEHYKQAGESVVIIANHTSFLDVVLIYAFLPDELLFAINSFTSHIWWIRPFLYFSKVFELDPLNPLAIKTLIREVKKGQKCVIFPEGRITTTGALMKLYEGPGLIADHAKVNLLPIRLQGAQYTPFSRLRGKVQIRWFPKIYISILPPRKFIVDPTMSSRKRRQLISNQLYDMMVEMLFCSTDYNKTLFQSLLEAKSIHKGPTKILEDITRVAINYNQLITRCFILGPYICRYTKYQETVGLLLPNMISAVVSFFTLQAYGRIPALLNYTAGIAQIESACKVAQVHCIFTSRKFIEVTNLFELINRLNKKSVQIIYLEDLKKEITWKDKLRASLLSQFPHYYYKKLKKATNPQDPAVILFTSGSEGEPKGVVLSHKNIQANLAQMTTQVDFNQRDIFFSSLPLFHAFGLTACIILPIYHGIKTFIYPSPLHYRKVPNMIYECNATIMFGADTFLAGYGRYAHPYDFYSIRYVFAGAEKLKEKTRKLWMEKFGIRIFEGYGVTEASPVISVNTPMQNKPGTVGNFLPGIRYEIEPISEIKQGGRLLISGPNIMLGYLSTEQIGEIIPPSHGWYDTGDIVEVDAEGYLTIKDRAKRFAKISGEMVSLTGVENIIYDLWPDKHHAILSVPDTKKGEQLVLVTDYKLATRLMLIKTFKVKGLPEISLPRKLCFIDNMPLLGSGKVNYLAVKNWLEQQF
ncbi:MAG: acyl-[ACP]--phospholipid O-acyltransferase [Candidatus Aquirickettsiella sp.]